MNTAVLGAGAPVMVHDGPAWDECSRDLAHGHRESYVAVQGMHCAACSLAVEQALLGIAGVTQAQVNAASETARVVWSPLQTRPGLWPPVLARSGYGALPAGDQFAAAHRRREQRLLLWRWLVAGFCMMQVMMYAFPAYIAQPGEISPDAQALLRWASWTLTLPVVLFSCTPFFGAALRDLRQVRVGMDVPVSLGVFIAFAASSAATADPGGAAGGEVWYDSVAMFVFFLLSGRLLEMRLRDRTAGALESLMRRLPQTTLRRGADGAFERVASRSVVAGDVVRVLPGETVPADGVVLEGESRVDEALLTGEPRALARLPGNQVVAGSHNLSGALLVKVERAGAKTQYAQIVTLMQEAALAKPDIALLADRIARPFLLLVLAAAAFAALWWWPQGPAHALGIAVAVLVVTCPCALSLAAPAATLAAAGALARRGILVRNLRVFEAAVDTVVFDKTGTLTREQMGAHMTGLRPGEAPAQAGAMASALAAHSLHPVAAAIAATFDSGAWRASEAVECAGAGVRGVVAAPGCGERRVALGSAVFCGAPPDHQGADGPCVHLADDRGWLASFELQESLRPDAIAAIARLKLDGIDVQLLSGDSPNAVRRLAIATGITGFLAQQTPAGKLARMQELQRAGRRVVMVGDGMNDAPGLACADVAVAIGQAVPVAQARADVVVPGGQVAAVPLLLEQGRRARRIVRQNLAWAALYNAACIPAAMAGAMPAWLAGLGMAASSFIVIANSARLAHLRPA